MKKKKSYILNLVNFFAVLVRHTHKSKRMDNASLLVIRLIVFLHFISFLNIYTCCIVIGIDQLEKSLCKSKACPNYSKCKIDENGYYAKCYCPYDCDLNDLNSMLEMFETPLNYTSSSMINIRTDQPVCGTNGKDYANFCELQKEACKENSAIRIAYLGKCDPCVDSQCIYPEICRLNVRREPVCVCNYQCSLDFKPVCGTDGKTYINECFMRLEACRLNRPIKVYQPVECSLSNYF